VKLRQVAALCSNERSNNENPVVRPRRKAWPDEVWMHAINVDVTDWRNQDRKEKAKCFRRWRKQLSSKSQGGGRSGKIGSIERFSLKLTPDTLTVSRSRVRNALRWNPTRDNFGCVAALYWRCIRKAKCLFRQLLVAANDGNILDFRMKSNNACAHDKLRPWKSVVAKSNESESAFG